MKENSQKLTARKLHRHQPSRLSRLEITSVNSPDFVHPCDSRPQQTIQDHARNFVALGCGKAQGLTNVQDTIAPLHEMTTDIGH